MEKESLNEFGCHLKVEEKYYNSLDIEGFSHMARRTASCTRWGSPERFPIRIADLFMMRDGWMISAQRSVEKTNER